MFADWQIARFVAVLEHEMLLFAAAFFLLGALDELAVDLSYAWLRLRGRAKTDSVKRGYLEGAPLSAPVAVFVPCWQEADVIADTLRHMLAAWPQAQARIYVGYYASDPDTQAAIASVEDRKGRLRAVRHDRPGPTTKGDCLNRIYEAFEQDERTGDIPTRFVILHDAEDRVDPAAIALLDQAMDVCDFVQLPVLPEIPRRSPWIAGHYADEFADSHGRTMVVRDALGAGIPGAGVGSAIGREMLARLSRERGGGGPFSVNSLTEDYETGLTVADLGGTSRFLRARGEDGRLIATRAYFPATLQASVRQKSRWLQGIALEGWDRMDWGRGIAGRWMRLRDRKAPLTAFVLAIAYALIVLIGITSLCRWAGLAIPAIASPTLDVMLWLCTAALVWRAAIRFAFVAREYGWWEGVRAVLRMPIGNIVAIMAGRRAVASYIRALGGTRTPWDKTRHFAWPDGVEQTGATKVGKRGA